MAMNNIEAEEFFVRANALITQFQSPERRPRSVEVQQGDGRSTIVTVVPDVSEAEPVNASEPEPEVSPAEPMADV